MVSLGKVEFCLDGVLVDNGLFCFRYVFFSFF